MGWTNQPCAFTVPSSVIDGISKPFAATGVRVRWVVGPPDIVQKMSSIIGHVGAWAPRAEQVAVAKLLSATDVIKAYHRGMKAGLQARLEALYRGIAAQGGLTR